MVVYTARISYAEVQRQFEESLIGLNCTGVEKCAPESWTFRFENKASLNISCPWRVFAKGHICLGHADHEQKFGLPAALDAQEEALKLLSGVVVKITVRESPADLALEFECGTCLEVFNNSGGYEGWQYHGPDGFELIALGGGGVATVRGVGPS